MSDTMLFGKKDKFAIELGFMKTPGMYKLCFWVEGKKMGSFTKGGELSYSITAFRQFVTNKESYYLPVFEGMGPSQINKYLVDDLFVMGRSTKSEIEALEKRMKFHLFWGRQFSNDGSDITLLYKNSSVIFVYSPPKKTTATKHIVSFEEFTSVFNDFIEYSTKSMLV